MSELIRKMPLAIAAGAEVDIPLYMTYDLPIEKGSTQPPDPMLAIMDAELWILILVWR